MRSDFALSPQQRADARVALGILAGTGFTLEQAARMAITGRRALERVTVATAAERFLANRMAAGLRGRSLDWYEDKIRLVVAKFGARLMDDVSRGDIVAWLPTVSKAKGSQAAAARAARALWRWSAIQDPALVGVNVCTDLPTSSSTNHGDAPFLAPAIVGRILETAGPYRSALALLFFAGIRPDEMAGKGKPRLAWSAVDPVARLIRISGDIAKTTKPRIIEGLPETVWSWIEPGEPTDPISRGLTREALLRAKTIVADWPHDATRHTFATYALAFTADPGRVSVWLGHEGNPALLHRTYRGLATKAVAEQFWALRPGGQK